MQNCYGIRQLDGKLSTKLRVLPKQSPQVLNRSSLLIIIIIIIIKGKVHPRTGHEGPEEEQMCSSTLPSTSATDGRWVVNATPRPLYSQERPGTHCTEGWVGHRAGLDGCEKSRPPPVFDPRTVQSVASRYTD